MREIQETAPTSSLQYSIESVDRFDDCRAAAYQCGLQAMDRAQERALTPIYFSSYSVGAGFDSAGAQSNSKNYYQIKNNFAKY
ncbi:MAG: hypothetical protein KGS72_28250 [Cyanobacteria bacterium REEB67]|nr:hypothetical protein [Cyanobacteria bacterium REEB67]